ncbi:UDP-N-acetylglucosamine--N-acetylmuramyl-(pentapeptide) pyrophosphoryl-undecaprenol N-acetylglucosamine transferase [Evansella vedderi]|uniref:UDP-N-acetylglucosamine--N-acetylmuramyl-(pentapeptide) pyrophosphoryl-undecaprenol N-acetylglucosamine transferase n=1 Tax=Evansella vedderi TaxID=38282 RepID=A0ABT9ZRE8_9BACI|nr:undecaprenyldiphospho-muramoylpentapeptide beta-N-acetylglucosaminyltransferase [Evansella vedderi]MDQ0253816.1 UDP-N-acetylglucosamine--N-acetylmuramyl-(pentapeptide) pyrophosphoryl-undecaprenol N-acetylglucosamine transferase [Evansella vedderi]
MKVLVTGGGTGGHIYPALALIRAIRKHNEKAEYLYIGTEKGLESKIVPKENIPFKTVKITGFKRSISVENVKTVMRFLKAVNVAKKYIQDFKPDVVIGTGGYVCGPVVYAAAKRGIPTIIHEQNSVPGLTNKFLSRYVDKIAISFESSRPFFPENKIVFTGNPRAQEVVEAAKSTNEDSLTSLGLSPDKRTVLVVGGSRGARPINEAIIGTLDQWENKEYQCLYVTGEVHYERVKEEMEKQGAVENVVCVPYIHDMPKVLSKVDLIVARAGATTLSEITALGLPSILIPSPYVTNNHQEKNARSLEQAKAAIVILEKEMSPERLFTEMDTVLSSPFVWEEMHKGALSIGKQDAGDELYRLITQLVK